MISTKSDLIKDVASALSLPEAKVKQMLDCTLHMILGAAAAGDGYALKGFGTFAPKIRKARTGRNPQTGAPIDLPETRSLGFKPARLPKAGA